MYETIVERARNLIYQEKYESITLDLKTFDSVYIDYYSKFYRYVDEDLSDVFNFEEILEATKTKIRHGLTIGDFTEDEVALIIHLVTLHVIRRLNFLSVLKEETQPLDIDLLDQLKLKQGTWFRGQKSFNYSLVPSYFRLQSDHGKVSSTSLEGYYKRHGYMKKLEAIFGSGSLDFNKLAFVQHTISLTPLLDFTEDVFVASVFALEPLESTDDAALYLLDTQKVNINLIDEAQADQVIKDLNIEYYNNKPKVSTLIKSPLYRHLLTGQNSSTFSLFNIKTNDRMKMQKGTFVLFNQVIFVHNNIIASSNTIDDLKGALTKIRIPSEDKDGLLKHIHTVDDRYHYEVLMEPYKYMESK